MGLVVLALVASHLLRTRPVVGSTVRSNLTRLVEGRDVSFRAQSLQPAGLTGVALRDVHLRARRNGWRLQLDVDGLEVYPSWRALVEGRIEPGRVVVESGDLHVERVSTSFSPDTSPSPSTSTTDTNERESTASPPALPPSPRIVLREIEVSAGWPRRHLQTHPVSVAHLDFEADPDAPLASFEPRGYGQWPDGVSFALSTSWSERLGGAIVTVDPDERLDVGALVAAPNDSPLRLQRWLSGLSTERATACLACRRRRLCLEAPRLDAPSNYDLHTSRFCAELDDARIETTLDEARILRDGEPLPYRLEDVEVSGRRSGDHADLHADLASPDHGGASLRARWRGGDRFEVDVETEALHLDELWRLMGWQRHLRGGILDGGLSLQWERNLELATLETDLGYRHGVVRHDFVDDAPLTVGRAHLESRVVADLGARALSIPEATLRLDDATPVAFSGAFVDARPGWSFELRIGARDVRAPRLLDDLPRPLAHPALGARLEGEFDASMVATGHTAFPESLGLDVDVTGDVDVLRDSPYSNVFGLALEGPPPPEVPARPFDLSLRQWVDIDALPDHVPRTVIGAEDADFYEHPGFNWRGIRNAMAHNLEVDELERGGSTITQQLAKNLFLTQERTLARKFKESWVTWRLESALPKDRILELYLNIVEWGPGDVQGLRAAARHYFDRKPDELEISQTALLAAILPGPDLYGSMIDRGYLPASRIEKVEHILSNLGFWDVISTERYHEIYEKARNGEIGGLELTICADDGTPDGSKHVPPNAPECSQLPPHDG